MYIGILILIDKLVVGYLFLFNFESFFYLMMLFYVNFDSFFFLLCDLVDRLLSGRKRFGSFFIKRG